MNQVDKALADILRQRQDDLLFRELEDNSHLIDFASNDYLGLARSAWLKQQVEQELKRYPYYKEGATGSRLITGNHTKYVELEERIATYHLAESGLMFNSGYDANLGFFSAVPQPGDLVLADELVHASIRDGLKLTRGNRSYFLHSDLVDLEHKLSEEAQNKFVVVESVYSMDGDFAPLLELVKLCRKFDAHLVVDEAHATGLFGPRGAGRVVGLGLEKEVYARVITFGKALGSHGAIVLGSQTLTSFLVNYARSFIYTTALPFVSIIRLEKVYDILSKQEDKVNVVSNLCEFIEVGLEDLPHVRLLPGNSHIKSLLIPGSEQAKHVSSQLRRAGIYAKAILYPTVPRGKERIRICVHAFNTKAEIETLVTTIKQATK